MDGNRQDAPRPPPPSNKRGRSCASKETEAAQERHGLPTQNAGEILLADLKDRYLAAQKALVSGAYYDALESRPEGLSEPEDERKV